MHESVERWSSQFARFMLFALVAGMQLYNLVPMYHNYSVGAFSAQARRAGNLSYRYSVYYLYPGFDPDDHFFVATIFNYYMSWCCAVSVVGIDLLLCLMVFQLVARLKLLNAALRHLGASHAGPAAAGPAAGPAAERSMLTRAENARVHNELKQCIFDHTEIAKFAAEMSSFFGPLLGLNYFFHLVCCCLLLLQCSTGELATLIRFGPLTLIIFLQLILISMVFEVVDTESEKLSDSVYSAPWELMDGSNRSTVCFLLQRVQRSIQVTAFGVTPVGVRTMAGILKTTFSYFTFLRSMD